MSQKPKLLAIGGAHIDRRGQLNVDYLPGASNPGTMREEVGGGVFNAARIAAQLGIQTAFLSVRGGDVQGEAVARAIKNASIQDLSSVFLDRQTATYTAILDKGGDIITALADMAIYETALPRQIARRKTRDAIALADAILTDANMPSEAIRRLLALADGKPVYAIAISPAKIIRFSGLLDQFTCIFMNRREAKSLAGLEQSSEASPSEILANLTRSGLKSAVMTDSAASVWLLNKGVIANIRPPSAHDVVDVTGAGDALAGTATAAMMQDIGFAEAVMRGVASAVATVESREAVIDLHKNERFDALFRQLKSEGMNTLEEL